MPLDSLLSLVEKLRERIEEHGSELRKSEAQTRYALIDPLLRELGWDTGDPALVIPEYKVGGGRADYALLNNGKPIMMVEAKNLGTPLQDGLDQGITYAMKQGTPYFSVTDGGRWEIYETHKPVPIAEKRIVQFDLKGGSAAEECLKALVLWRPNVNPGQLAPGQAPVVVPTPNRSARQESPIPNTQPTPPRPDEHKWEPISKLIPQKGSRPAAVQFPDNSVISVKSWKELLVEVARWLITNNHLTPSHCPIRKTSRSKKYVVHTEPVHEDGTSFDRRDPVESLYVHRSGGAEYDADVYRGVIESVGQDPAQFKVRFS